MTAKGVRTSVAMAAALLALLLLVWQAELQQPWTYDGVIGSIPNTKP